MASSRYNDLFDRGEDEDEGFVGNESPNPDPGFSREYDDESNDEGFTQGRSRLGNYQIKVPKGLVTSITQRKKRQTATDRVRQVGDEIESEINQRQTDREEYSKAIASPVPPGNWYTRLLKGGLASLANRNPGESLAEALGKGLGMAVGSAAYKPAYQAVGKDIRDKDLTQIYKQKQGVSNDRMQDLLGKRKIANEEQAQMITTQREERLFDKGIEDIDIEREKIKQGTLKLEQTKADQEKKNAQADARITEQIRRNKAQEAINSRRVDLTEEHYAEIERHNKAVESKAGPDEIDSYIIQSIDPKGNVKPITLKVRKGEDPLDYVKQIQTTAGGKTAFPTTAPKADATPGTKASPKSIQDRNKTALDKLKAGSSKNLPGLIKKN